MVQTGREGDWECGGCGSVGAEEVPLVTLPPNSQTPTLPHSHTPTPPHPTPNDRGTIPPRYGKGLSGQRKEGEQRQAHQAPALRRLEVPRAEEAPSPASEPPGRKAQRSEERRVGKAC